MKLSTKMRYGTRAMLELALSYKRGPINLREIAGRQQISHKYLESLIAMLRAGGLVRSVRGASGGHVLARSPDQITLREVFELLEGSEGLVHCTTNPESCEMAGLCVTQEVWAQMHGACMGVLESFTLEALAHRAEEIERSQAVMYYI